MQLRKIFIYGTLALNGLIVTDSFLLPSIKREEIYERRSSVTSGGVYHSRRYTTDYLITKSGHSYELPDHCYIHRMENDSVTMGVTRLFRRTASAGWCEARGCFTADLRMFRTSLLPLAVLCITSLFLLALLLFPPLLTEQRDPYIYMAAFFMAMLFVFYFW